VNTIIPNINDASTLWSMPYEDFNEWRATGDLPRLLEFLKTRLPQFELWLALYGVDDNRFCRVVHTSNLFLGTGPKVLYRETNFFPNKELYSVVDMTLERFRAGPRLEGREPPDAIEVVPYFLWAKRRLGRARYFATTLGQHMRTDSFVYNRWRSPDEPQASRAYLLSSFEVVKIGGVDLGQYAGIGHRNLDFADLDHLAITGKFNGSYPFDVAFSSCRNMRLDDAEVNFFRFIECPMEGFRCERTHAYQLSLHRCGALKAKFREARLVKPAFTESVVEYDFDRCDLIDLSYSPSRGAGPRAVADNCRRFRAAFQSTGRREEASKWFYSERVSELRALRSPLASFPEKFILRGYGGTLHTIYSHWYKREFGTQQCLRWASDVVLRHILVWLTPRNFWEIATFKARYLSALFSWTLWGFGERPLRVVVAAVSVIAGFASIFYSTPDALRHAGGGNALVEAAYFSTVTFTTLGYGDVIPLTDNMRLTCALEAVCGAFLIGLFIAGFSNKNRY
jgi:hypothetical protein